MINFWSSITGTTYWPPFTGINLDTKFEISYLLGNKWSNPIIISPTHPQVQPCQQWGWADFLHCCFCSGQMLGLAPVSLVPFPACLFHKQLLLPLPKLG